MPNRRRHGNVVPLASIATWIVLGFFAAGGGFYYVYCKNQLHKSGGEIRRLEVELTALRNQNEDVKARIAKLSSPNELRKRREKDRNFLPGYSEITRDRLVVVSDSPAPRGELRPVSNSVP